MTKALAYDYRAEHPEWRETGDAWKKEHFRFCASCGGRMIEVSDPTPIQAGFDRVTGEQQFRIDGSRSWQCERFVRTVDESHDQMWLAIRRDTTHLIPVQECHAWAHVWITDQSGGGSYKVRHCSVCARPEISSERTGNKWVLHDDGFRVCHCPDCGITEFVCRREGSGWTEAICYQCGRYFWGCGGSNKCLPPVIGIPRD